MDREVYSLAEFICRRRYLGGATLLRQSCGYGRDGP